MKENRTLAILPALNEEHKIGIVVAGILKEKELVDSVLVVDDGSKDGTRKEAESAGAVVLSHPKNMGVGAALRTGFEHALKNNFEIVVVMGADDQDNPSEMRRVIRPLVEDQFDFVQGSRYMPGGQRVNIPFFRWITTGLYSFIFKLIVRFPLTDGTNGFRAFKTRILKDPGIDLDQRWLNRYELEPYLYYKAIELNYNVTEVPVTKKYPRDKIGYTKMIPFLDWWSILKPLIFLRLGLKK
jgi:dolichol-phosphate mannosyltransferase